MPMDRLKMTLLKIFGNGRLSPEDLELPEDHGAWEHGMKLEDIATEDLLKVTISFVKAYGGSKADISSHISRVLDLDVFEQRPKETSRDYSTHSSNSGSASDKVLPGDARVLNLARDAGRASEYEFDPKRTYESICNNVYSRSDMVYLMEKVKSFRFDFIDWEDREFLIEMIKYTFYRSLLMLRSVSNREGVEKCKDGAHSAEPRMQAYVLAPCGHINPIYNERKELLSRRLKPTMSLDDYARTVLDDMKKKEKPESNSSEGSKDKKPRDEDFDDYKRNFRGNTKNMS